MSQGLVEKQKVSQITFAFWLKIYKLSGSPEKVIMNAILEKCKEMHDSKIKIIDKEQGLHGYAPRLIWHEMSKNPTE